VVWDLAARTPPAAPRRERDLQEERRGWEKPKTEEGEGERMTGGTIAPVLGMKNLENANGEAVGLPHAIINLSIFTNG
jgi:hypothetical protein